MTGHVSASNLAEEVACKVGLSFSASRKGAVASAISRIMDQHGLGDSQALLDRLGLDQDLADDAIAAITVGETHFFRDPEQFRLIRQAILPELRRRRPVGRPLRMWSLGCATGEEPYSLAILCEEEGALNDVRISAADVSRKALAAATTAEYGEWPLRNTDQDVRARYFTPSDGRYRLNEGLRRQVDFAYLNLGHDELPAPERGLADFDLILCRNLLVYVDASAVRRIARQLFACLAGGGWLLTAPTDPPLWKYAPFETSITPGGVVYRRTTVEVGSGKTATVPFAVLQRHAGKAPLRTPRVRSCVTGAPNTHGRNPAKSIAGQIHDHLDRGENREAAHLARQGVESYPLSAEIHFAEGLCHVANGENDAGAAAFRRVVYLDSTLAAAQFFLGVCLKDSDQQAALRALENALRSCLSRPPRERVALMPEATAGQLAKHARREIGQIQRLTRSKA
ncbi:protein-glutamate O-methyltransferase CheR (plasmid) [Sinorhizobium meliloti]|uniref:protein-glutamate O-methyltransferase CheR n=1 Tax=Rhizobium meliloti TaxID=382 RepID=UPI002D76E358|nr:protein-glutamate O-methyltransferase CheR [Sinorhizobium meliloti]WRQ71156.1 protein-glutamate O-methyltransferase CheR [Sinorhizobium meliloti]